jgi:glucose-1-phosphate cytidylyltransferase
MVEIGGEPILWHIMNIYSYHGFNEFIICLGYKGDVIKDYFVNYYNMHSDLRVDLSTGHIEAKLENRQKWIVDLIDTDLNTMTGGRLKRIEKYVDGNEFLMTYGDGVSDINISELVTFHRMHRKLVTMTAVQPEGRFGSLDIDNNGKVLDFDEKPPGDGRWVNGGFFVINKKALNFIGGDHTIWENEPLKELSHRGDLAAYRHHGFWKPMDTLSDKIALEKLWSNGKAPWKVWD